MTNGNEKAAPYIKTTHEHGNRNGVDWNYGNVSSTGGLTIREHFAAMAITGLCANKKVGDIMNGECVDIANSAVAIADALIEALNKTQTT